MRFVEPWFALLFLPLAAGLWFSFRHVHGLVRRRKALAFGLRALMASLLIFALMGPQWRLANQGLAVVYVVDRSDSIRDSDKKESEGFVRRAVGELPSGALAAVVVFGKTPALESSAGGRRELGPFSAVVDGSGSDMAAALRLASGVMPEGRGRRIVVLSDGNETAGKASQAVEAARLEGIQVDFVALGSRPMEGEASVAEVSVPPRRRQDEPFEVRVAVEASRAQEAVLALDRDGVVVERRKVDLPQGRSRFLLSQRLPSKGFFRYRVTLEPSIDTDTRNNVGAGFVNIAGPSQVMVVQGREAGDALVRSLRAQGLAVSQRDPASLPSRPEDLQPYEAVILNDLNAADVHPSIMEMLRQAARDSGVGLAMVGGENSFLPGGWYGTPVAEALPVDLDIRQRKSFPSVSVLIMVDASGSMAQLEGGLPKIRLAARAAEETAKLLTPRDRLAVAGSTDGIEFVLPFGLLTDKNRAYSQIRRLSTGGGGIFAEPTIQRAERELNREESKVRHFILLADGDDTDDYGTSLDIVARMKQNKITTSVVAIGKGKDLAFLQQVARAGGGNFYIVQEAGRLPAIFTQDVSLITRAAIEEGAFVPRATAGEEALAGIDAVPPLLAYCLTEARPLARTGMRTHKDDPLLATWQYGLGRTLAFTSDAQPRWASRWMGWDGFGRFWAQAVRSFQKQPGTGSIQTSVAMEGGKAKILVEGEGVTESTQAVVSGPNGEPRPLRLVQTGPRQFQAEADARQMGSYLVSVREGARSVETSGFAVAYPAEYRSFVGQKELLERLAEGGGGRLLDAPRDSLRPLEDPGSSIRDLWFWLLLASLLLLPLDVAVRRLVLPLGDWLKLIPRREKAAPARAERLERLETLKSVKAPPSAPPPAAPTNTPSPRRSPPPSTDSPASARDRLLEGKRKRQKDS